jgi:hypothetical protein
VAAPEAPPAPTPQLLPGAAKADAQVGPQGVTAPVVTPETIPDGEHLPSQKADLPPNSAELVALLTSYSDWDRELSIDQLRYAVGLLTHKAERHADRLRELDELHRRAKDYLKAVAQIPWMEGPLSIDDYLSPSPDISVESALEHLANVEQEATHLLQVHSQLEALGSRLGDELSLPVSREVTNLGDIAAGLEEYARHLTERLQQISLQEENVAEFFDRFTAADQESGHRLVENTESSRWVEIANFIMAAVPKTDAGKRYEKLVGRSDLVGLIVAHLWRLDADKAIEIAGSAVGNKQAPLTRAKQIEALAFLTFGQLQQLTDSYSDTAPSVAEIISVAAISSGRFETLEYLEPMLHSPSINAACADFYKAVINMWRRGLLVDPAGQLNPALPTHRTAPPENLAEKQRERLLDLIRQPPGMTHNYYRLRVIARTRFFIPLEEALKTGDPKTVWEKWISYGILDEMVEECVSASGKGKDLNSSHWSQTRRYLEIFQIGLERWRRMSRESHTDEDSEVSKALTSLHRERRSNPSNQVDSLLTTLTDLFEAGRNVFLLPLDFGERCTTDGMVEVNTPPQDLVRPTMTQSWPIAIAKGIVPLSVLLTDQFRHALGVAPVSLKEALQELLKRNEFHAAQCAADGDAELQRYVEEELDKKKTAFLMDPNRAALLNEAQNVRVHDKDIDVCLVEIDKALYELDFDGALQWLGELDTCIHRFKMRQDPIRRALIDFLREAKTSFQDDAPLGELDHLASIERINHEYRRLHLLQLQDERLPSWLRDAWSASAQRMDRPALWPTEEVSLKLAKAIETLVKFIVGRLRYRNVDPEAVDTLIQRLGEWIPAQIHIGLETRDNQRNGNIWKTLFDFAEEIGGYCPDSRIWQVIGASEPQRHLFRDVPESLEQSRPLKLDHLEFKKIEGGKLAFVDFVREVREALIEQMDNEPAGDGADHAKLRTAARRSDWTATRALAAALIRDASHILPQDSISDVEAIYAVALAYSSPPRELELLGKVFQNACLAVLSAGNGLLYYLPPAMLDDVVARAFVVMCNIAVPPDSHNLPVGEQLGQSLVGIVEMSRSDTIYEWLSELFWKASYVRNKDGVRGSAKLAAQLWECLTGAKNNAKSRCDLLNLLYRIRRTEALRYLAAYTKPLDELIITCINAFELAESDSEVRPRALQISAAVRDQARGTKNTKPWSLLFHRLEQNRSETSGPSLSCTLETQFVDEGEDGTVTIELRLVPSIFDPPESLQLELGGTPLPPGHWPSQINLLSEEEALLKEKVIPIQAPLITSDSAGGILQLPYRFTGTTIQGSQIDIRGSWTLQSTGKVSEVIPDGLIRAAWPGATGEPVNRSGTDRGFYGREQEIREVEAHLQAPDRQRSVMIFGQRRIGKTSLLVEMVDMLKPSPGHVCGVFLDVAGLSIPDERGSMPKAFFDYVVSALDSHPRNAPIRRALEDRTGTKVEIHRLAKSLNPGASLADALEGLVERLSEQSKGAVSRIALFVDEFDRFVKPLLSERKTEVDRLMWSLRPIIQLSRRISLVLAGSGLQRLFVEHYDDALFGSIDEVELKPFNWGDDQEAIESTFIPLKAGLRERLCKGDSFHAITKHAYELCGGHPYYLAMLGYAAALFSRGHQLTPPLLNRVAELMIRGEIRSVGPNIDAKRFYAHIFETLQILRSRTSVIAKILLAHISQRTTADYPWLAISKFPRPQGGAFLKTLKQFQLSPLLLLMMPNGAPKHVCRHLVPHRAGKGAVLPHLSRPQLPLEFRKFLNSPTGRDPLQAPHDLSKRVARRKIQEALSVVCRYCHGLERNPKVLGTLSQPLFDSAAQVSAQPPFPLLRSPHPMRFRLIDRRTGPFDCHAAVLPSARLRREDFSSPPTGRGIQVLFS